MHSPSYYLVQLPFFINQTLSHSSINQLLHSVRPAGMHSSYNFFYTQNKLVCENLIYQFIQFVYSPSIDPLVGAKLTPYLKWDTKLNFYSETFAFQIKIEAFCKYSVKYCISNSWFVYKRVPMFYWEL